MEQIEAIAPMILFLVLIFAMMYFLMIRPQRRRQKEQQELLDRIRKGEKVVTSGGIYGQIESITDDTVVIKLESGATMRVAKGSVVSEQQKREK
jgi:preprotein translocase subunit YajC